MLARIAGPVEVAVVVLLYMPEFQVLTRNSIRLCSKPLFNFVCSTVGPSPPGYTCNQIARSPQEHKYCLFISGGWSTYSTQTMSYAIAVKLIININIIKLIIITKLSFQRLDGEQLGHGTNSSQEARVDIRANGFWNSNRHVGAFFDVQVFHPHAPCTRTCP